MYDQYLLYFKTYHSTYFGAFYIDANATAYVDFDGDSLIITHVHKNKEPIEVLSSTTYISGPWEKVVPH